LDNNEYQEMQDDIRNSAPTATEPKPKVTFTPEQQVRLDEIIRESQGRAGREAREEAARLRQELAALRAATPHPDDTGTRELASQLAEANAERSALKQANSEAQIMSHLRAVSGEFVDIELAARIMREQVKNIDGKTVVVDSDGHARLNASYEPMTTAELAAELVAAKPFLARGRMSGGSGSVPDTAGPTTSSHQLEKLFGRNQERDAAKKLNAMAIRDPRRYQALKAQARAKGLI
jgi:hypothetical protein